MVFWLGPATDGDLGLTNLAQWICREWVQKLGSDGATICVEIGDDQAGAKNRTRRPNALGGKDSSSENMNSRLVSLPRPLPFVGDLSYYISFPFVHHLPTLVSHPYPFLSARPIGHSFWRSVSCYGPNSTVQRSRSHKWGQGVSYGYLIRRWQLLPELFFYHTLMAGPLGSKLPLGCSNGLPLAAWRFPLPWFWFVQDRVIIGSIFWQSGFPSFVLGHFFLLGVSPELDMRWVEVPRSFGPTIVP